MSLKYFIATKVLKILPDKMYLKILYRFKAKKKLNLKKPKTLNDKIQWLKINDRKDIYTQMVDKNAAKKIIADIAGEEYVIPTLGVWDKFDDINFDELPNSFVLKTTHDSGGVVICKDKKEFDLKAAKDKINKSLKTNYYYSGREWPYKNVKPKIIAEQYIEDLDGLIEYKIFCFNGKAKIVLICKGKAHSDERTNDYCDLDLNRYPFKALYPNSEGEIKKPKELEKMIELSEKLSKDIPFLRNDFYLTNGKIYIGELTFYHNSGIVDFEPEEWNEKLGEWLILSSR